MTQPSRPFKVLGINHTGLAPKDPSVSAQFLNALLGLTHVGDEHVASQKTLTSMYLSNADSHASPRLEILADDATGDGPIGKFLAKKGAGIHHLALTVDHVDAAIAYLMSQGVRMIDTISRPGAHQTRIAFIHPESTGGLLIELVEESH